MSPRFLPRIQCLLHRRCTALRDLEDTTLRESARTQQAEVTFQAGAPDAPVAGGCRAHVPKAATKKGLALQPWPLAQVAPAHHQAMGRAVRSMACWPAWGRPPTPSSRPAHPVVRHRQAQALKAKTTNKPALQQPWVQELPLTPRQAIGRVAQPMVCSIAQDHPPPPSR